MRFLYNLMLPTVHMSIVSQQATSKAGRCIGLKVSRPRVPFFLYHTSSFNISQFLASIYIYLFFIWGWGYMQHRLGMGWRDKFEATRDLLWTGWPCWRHRPVTHEGGNLSYLHSRPRWDGEDFGFAGCCRIAARWGSVCAWKPCLAPLYWSNISTFFTVQHFFFMLIYYFFNALPDDLELRRLGGQCGIDLVTR